MSVTIKDIARMANVSPATVSRILNHHEGFISEATRQRVLKIVEEQQYTPNPYARSLVTNRSKTIGVIVPDILNPFFCELLGGADSAAQKLGYNLLLCNSDGDMEKERNYIESLSQRSDGILLVSNPVPVPEEFLSRFKLPIVTIDRPVTSGKCAVGSVHDDLEQCGYQPTAYFTQSGHRNIAFLCGPREYPSSEQRYRGYCRALAEAGISVDPQLTRFGTFSHDFGYRSVCDMLDQGVFFSAICCMSDMLALGAMQALRERQRAIPEDCAIIGCDDIFLSRMLEHPLSAVKRNIYQMGVRGVELLVEAMGQETPKFREEILPVSLVLRATT